MIRDGVKEYRAELLYTARIVCGLVSIAAIPCWLSFLVSMMSQMGNPIDTPSLLISGFFVLPSTPILIGVSVYCLRFATKKLAIAGLIASLLLTMLLCLRPDLPFFLESRSVWIEPFSLPIRIVAFLGAPLLFVHFVFGMMLANATREAL
jgi:hypothetical protein